jgi:hypothetical protein
MDLTGFGLLLIGIIIGIVLGAAGVGVYYVYTDKSMEKEKTAENDATPNKKRK